MTSWQDQPPQSRRQLRLNERRDASDNHVDLAEPTPEQPTFETFPQDGWDAQTQPASDAPDAQQHRTRAEAAIASGRRSRHQFPHAVPESAAPQTEPSNDAAAAQQASPDSLSTAPTSSVPTNSEPTNSEPLNYFTQGRPQVPSYGGPSFGASAVAPVPSEAPPAETPRPAWLPQASDDSPAYRMRDFSPESRRTAFSSTAEEAPSSWTPPPVAGTPNGDLDYFTQQVVSPPEQVAAEQVAPQPDAQPVAATPAASWTLSDPVALEDAQLEVPVQVDQSVQVEMPVQFDQPAQFDQPVQAETPLSAEATVQATDRPLTRRELRALRQSQEPDEEQSDAPAMGESAPTPAVLTPTVLDAVQEFEALLAPQPAEPQHTVDPQPVAPQLVEPQPIASQPAAPQPAAEAIPEAVSPAPHPYIRPAGHWSTQADIEDDDAQASSRDVGVTGGAVTSNHLVISSVPTVNDLLSPLTSTGEIMVTGSIDLPRSLGTTGSHPARYDHSDVDALLEAGDREDSNVDSAPVRAIRAVSTHTSTRGVISAGKPPRSSNPRLPIILAISTAAVVVAGAGLVVAGFVFNVF